MTYRDNSCKIVQYHAMLTEQRKHLLLDRLRARAAVVAKDLSAELGLSEDTIRRDLRELAAAGLLTRVHGGALPASPTVAGLGARDPWPVEEKQRLAGRARPGGAGQTVFIDGGTTNLALVALAAQSRGHRHHPQPGDRVGSRAPSGRVRHPHRRNACFGIRW